MRVPTVLCLDNDRDTMQLDLKPDLIKKQEKRNKMSKKESNELVKHESGGLAAVPSFMQQYAGQGTENISAQDTETPRIKLLQALSPELDMHDDAKSGHFWHTIAQVNLGANVKIVPLYIDMRAILWNPRESGGGILARSDDMVNWMPASGNFNVKINKGTKTVTWVVKPSVKASGLLEWGSYDPSDENSQPAATKMINVVVALPDFPELPPAVVTLQRSSVKASKRFLGQLKLVRAPTFGCKFLMSSVDDKNGNGDKFKNFSFSAIGLVDNEQEFNTYKAYYDMFKSEGLKIKEEGEEIVAVDVSSEDNDAPPF